MLGSSHSHDIRYPDDAWNLYSMLDTEACRALNAVRPTAVPVPVAAAVPAVAVDPVLGVFKPFARRLDRDDHTQVLVSDADDEMLLILHFLSPVSIRKLMVIGGSSGGNGGNNEQQPARLSCYCDQENIDFNNVEDFRPAQSFNLPANPMGTVELITTLHAFTNITTLVLYFQGNLGDVESSVLSYIGMQGDHTHYKREAVNTVYEVLCNGQDICQPEDAHGATHHMH